MLLACTIGNYRSIADAIMLSMEAAKITEYEDTNVLSVGKTRILSSAALYGANASGKSNVLRALGVMRHLVLSSANGNETDVLDYQPFLLRQDLRSAPTMFEVLFVIDGIRYRYGFEYNASTVLNEWLYYKAKGAEGMYFEREGQTIRTGAKFAKAAEIKKFVRPNALFLSVANQLNIQETSRIIQWFSLTVHYTAAHNPPPHPFSVKMLQNATTRAQLQSFYTKLNLGFETIELTVEDFHAGQLRPDMPEDMKQRLIAELQGKKRIEIKTTHAVYDPAGNVAGKEAFMLHNQESDGTKKIVAMSGLIFKALQDGARLIIDELDANLHKNLSLEIIKLFHDPNVNRHGAQLIFATHDTNLLSAELFRRDQIYFTEKNETEGTELYSLVEFKHDDKAYKVRKDESFEKNYLAGRYGGVPYLENIKDVFKQQ